MVQGPNRGIVLLCVFPCGLAVGMGAATAQEAGEVQEVYELPAIEITTASPVEKPKKASSGASGGASRAPSPARRSARPPSPSRPSTQTSSRSRAPAQPAPVQSDEVLDIDIPAGISIVSGADSFVPVTVATEREILANPGATITDSLQNKPGISGTTFAPGANRPIIRGLDSYRVRIQENGIGSHDVSAISEDHAIPIDPADADKIEVVRGPSTLRYGSQAIGGVVSVENQRIPTYLPEHGFSGMIKGGGNTVDEGGDGAFSVTGGSNGIVLHADGFIRDYEDYETPLGEELNSFVDSKGGSAGISHVWDTGFIGVSYARFESLYGIPGEEAEEGFLPRIDLVQDKVLVKGEWRPNRPASRPSASGSALPTTLMTNSSGTRRPVTTTRRKSTVTTSMKNTMSTSTRKKRLAISRSARSSQTSSRKPAWRSSIRPS